MNLFAFGFGYSAAHFVRRHRDRFARVTGTVTSAGKMASLEAERVEAFHFTGDASSPDIERALADADCLLTSVPPDEEGDPVLRQFADAIARAPRLSWIGYLSTVGVYGDHRGGWVDETTPATPASRRSQARVSAESAWLDLGRRSAKAVHVFRLAGIYGPGRNALVQLARGTARRIVKPGQVFNRIHVEDIAALLMASIERPNAGAVYNVGDDEPAPPQDVVAYGAALLGVEPPPEIPFAAAQIAPMAASFYGECKRVSNRRIRDELGVSLGYPSYREGLAALLAAGEGRAPQAA